MMLNVILVTMQVLYISCKSLTQNTGIYTQLRSLYITPRFPDWQSQGPYRSKHFKECIYTWYSIKGIMHASLDIVYTPCDIPCLCHNVSYYGYLHQNRCLYTFAQTMPIIPSWWIIALDATQLLVNYPSSNLVKLLLQKR